MNSGEKSPAQLCPDSSAASHKRKADIVTWVNESLNLTTKGSISTSVDSVRKRTSEADGEAKIQPYFVDTNVSINASSFTHVDCRHSFPLEIKQVNDIIESKTAGNPIYVQALRSVEPIKPEETEDPDGAAQSLRNA